MSTNLNLELLCFWPGYLSDSQNHLAIKALQSLVLENHSYDDIVDIVHDFGKSHSHEVEQVSTSGMIKGDKQEYERAISVFTNNLLKSPDTFADGISFVAKSNIKIHPLNLPKIIEGFENTTPFVNSSQEHLSQGDISKFCQNKTSICFLMAVAIKSDMVENVERLLKIPKIAKVYDPERVSSWLVDYALPERSRLSEKFLKAKPGFNPKSYVEYVREMLALAGFRKSQDPVPSVPTFARKVGHEVLRELMGNDSKEAMRVMQQLIRDGADWFMAFEQKRIGNAAYFDLCLRDVEPIHELGKVMAGAKHNGCKPLGQALIEALGEEPFLKLAQDQKVADNLWKEWKLPYLVGRVGERGREEILATELGL